MSCLNCGNPIGKNETYCSAYCKNIYPTIKKNKEKGLKLYKKDFVKLKKSTRELLSKFIFEYNEELPMLHKISTYNQGVLKLLEKAGYKLSDVKK